MPLSGPQQYGIEKIRQFSICIKRQNLRHILIWPDDNDTSIFTIY